MWPFLEYLRNLVTFPKVKVLVLLRGVPGAGKSTVADSMSSGIYPVLAADDYFMVNGEYRFDPAKLGKAHKSCQRRCKAHMERGARKIFVNNTFVKAKDMNPYVKMAQEHGYIVFSLVVENRHGGRDVHNVPEDALVRMEESLRNNLKFR